LPPGKILELLAMRVPRERVMREVIYEFDV
jgi:hypothetical protein